MLGAKIQSLFQMKTNSYIFCAKIQIIIELYNSKNFGAKIQTIFQM